MSSWSNILEEAIQHLPDKQYGRILRLAFRYESDGTEPAPETLSKIERVAFAFGKHLIDTSAGVEVEERPVEQRKKGGAPVGNTNAKKQPETTPKTTSETTEKQPETTSETTDHNNDHDHLNLNLDLKNNNDDHVNVALNTHDLIAKIIAESAQLGYEVDSVQAKKIINSGINPDWFEGRHSVLELMDQAVQKEYENQKKTDAELRRLFISSIKWEGVRLKFLAWRKDALAQDADQERQKARDNPPKQCECGAILDIHGHCHACGKAREFDTAKGRYVFTQTIKTAIPNGTLLRILQKRAVPEEVFCEQRAAQ